VARCPPDTYKVQARKEADVMKELLGSDLTSISSHRIFLMVTLFNRVCYMRIMIRILV
jgi:hypothetical protein